MCVSLCVCIKKKHLSLCCAMMNIPFYFQWHTNTLSHSHTHAELSVCPQSLWLPHRAVPGRCCLTKPGERGQEPQELFCSLSRCSAEGGFPHTFPCSHPTGKRFNGIGAYCCSRDKHPALAKRRSCSLVSKTDALNWIVVLKRLFSVVKSIMSWNPLLSFCLQSQLVDCCSFLSSLWHL